MRRLPLIPLLLVACGRPDAPAQAPSAGHLEGAREVRPPRDDAGDKDPKSAKTKGLGGVARWVPRPEILGAGTFASEERGTFRTALAGIRVQRLADGSVLTSEDRIRDELLQVTQIPRWLGSGYLFLTRNELSIAPAFTAPRKTIFSQPGSLQRAYVGTDRIFVTTSGGAVTAFDARTFVEVPTETLPGVPWLSSYAAKDAARAIAVFDLLGPVRTTDGGKTWQRLPIAAAISKVDVIRDTFLLQEASENGNNTNTLRRFVVDDDGSARLAGDAATLDAVVAPKAAGKDLLVAAIERGVTTASTKELEKLQAPVPAPAGPEEGRPSDESREALVVDGSDLVRLDLRRGAVLERAAFAFPPGTGRCVGTTLATQEFAAPAAAAAAGARPPGTAQGGEETASTNADPTKPAPRPKNAVGFLCEGADGGSWIYRLNDGKTPVLLRQFKHGRTIVPSGNGLLVVKGPCAVDGRQQPAEHRYCLFEGGEAFRDVDVRGDVGGERLVALGRGRLAVITPSHGVLTSARLTVLENGTARTVPLEFKDSDERARQDAKSGLWLDGFQEIAPGILAGWAELGGYYTGIRFDLTGSGTLYRAPSDRGNGTVGGRYGFFRSLNLRSFETTDFGKTWKEADAPALVGAARPKSLACSDVGCSLPGWLRVGWGVAPEKEKDKEIAKIKRPSSTVTPSFSSFRFVCERGKGYVPPPPRAEKEIDNDGDDGFGRFRGGFGYGGMGGPNEDLLVKKLTAFGGSPAPILGVDDRGAEMGARRAVSNESTDSAHIYAWGPKGTDFTQSGQLEIRWTPLYAEGLHPRRTARVRLPQAFADLIPGLSAFNGGGYANFTLVDTGDDRHALLHTTRYGMQQGSVVALLDANGAPTLVRREGGDPLPPIEDATRLGGRLYVSAQPSEFPPESVLYEVDGGTAREVARFPRYTKDGPTRGQQLRLARSTDGNRLGLVVTGRPASVAGTPSYWVVPFTPDTREFGTPFYAGDNGFRNFRDVPVCSAADDGYSLDMPIPSAAALDAGGDHVSMSSLEGRVRLSSEKVCIEALQGLATHEKNTFGWTAGAGPAIPLATLEGGEGRIAYSCRSARP